MKFTLQDLFEIRGAISVLLNELDENSPFYKSRRKEIESLYDRVQKEIENRSQDKTYTIEKVTKE